MINSATKIFVTFMGAGESEALIEEGDAKIYFPPNIDKSEVFYNPVQNFNRDITCLVLQAYNNRVKKPTNLFEAFAATGLRSIRYAREVTGFNSITANDIDKNAGSIIDRNIQLNKVDNIVKSSLGDANKVMNSHKGEYQIIDLDPYSTVSIFLDAAIHAAADGALLCVTSTDGRTLCGQQQEVSYGWYNVMVLNTEFCHEIGIRTLLTLIKQIAARYKKTIEPLISLAANFYFRVFVIVHGKSNETKHLASDNAYLLFSPDSHLFWLQPLGRDMSKGENITVKPAQVTIPSFKDPYTESQLQLGGPIYTGPIHNKEFIQSLIDLLPTMKFFKTTARIEAVLNSCIRELDSPFYYDISVLTGIIHSSTPSREILVSILEKLGYKTSGTHCKPGMLKTDAPGELIWDILRRWYFENDQKKLPEQDNSAKKILSAKQSTENKFTFEVDPEVKERIRLEKKICKFYMNPEKNFGPKAAAKKQKNK